MFLQLLFHRSVALYSRRTSSVLTYFNLKTRAIFIKNLISMKNNQTSWITKRIKIYCSSFHLQLARTESIQFIQIQIMQMMAVFLHLNCSFWALFSQINKSKIQNPLRSLLWYQVCLKYMSKLVSRKLFLRIHRIN